MIALKIRCVIDYSKNQFMVVSNRKNYITCKHRLSNAYIIPGKVINGAWLIINNNVGANGLFISRLFLKAELGCIFKLIVLCLFAV